MTVAPQDHASTKRGGSPRRMTWPPCVNCGDPDGDIVGSNKTPNRYDAARFGRTGKVCYTCFHSLRKNPNAVARMDRRHATARHLAAAILAFGDALNGNDEHEQAATLKTMLEMAEQTMGRM